VEAYEIVLTEAAAMMFATARRGEQRKLAVVLDHIKAAPFRAGDLQERDSQGRVNEVTVADDWLVTWWRDDAVRELRVVRLERVED
jgi:hypothetical protein